MTVERLLKRSLLTAHIQAGQQAAKLAKKCRYTRMAQEKNNSQVLDHTDQAKKIFTYCKKENRSEHL